MKLGGSLGNIPKKLFSCEFVPSSAITNKLSTTFLHVTSLGFSFYSD
jgi:hypothetical protein